MNNNDLFEEIQAVLDGMQEAVGQCSAGETDVDDMWTEIDGLCQKLAVLAEGADAEDADEDDEDAPSDLNFDEDEDGKGSDEDDDETLN